MRIINRIKQILFPTVSNLLGRREVDHYLSIRDVRKRWQMERIVRQSRAIHYLENEWGIETAEGTVFLRHDSSDVDVYWQIFVNGEYDAVINCARLNGIDVKTIIDAGGNIGLSSLKFAKNFPNARIIALEPDDGNYRQFVKNVGKLSEQVLPLERALWRDDATVYLHSDFRDGREWARSVSDRSTEDAVEGVSISSLIREYRLETIDLLKIDIEGGEADIFQPSSDLSFLDVIKIIAIEIHDERSCRERILEMLRAKRFVLFYSGELTIGLNTSFLSSASRSPRIIGNIERFIEERVGN